MIVYFRIPILFIAFISLSLSSSPLLQADEYTGKVVGVSDGDTITVLRNGRGEKVRLFGIDAPEQRQPFHARAKQYVSSLTFHKQVLVKSIPHSPRDQYNRTVAEVFVDGASVNYLLLRNGLAWWYRHFAPKEKRFQEAEQLARRERVGIWENKNPMPPWVYRRKYSKKR